MYLRRLCFLCFLALVTVGEIYGQAGAKGTIVGSVVDSTGAVISGATVSVTNTATGVTNSTQTSASGDYTIPYLNPGTYNITVQANGFEKSVIGSVGLVVAQTARVNAKLVPGEVSQTVSVTGNAVSLDTDTSAVSQTITNRQVEQLPMNGRNFLQLLFIGAGAVTIGGEGGVMRSGQGAAISINGQRPESNNYLLDGMPNTDEALNTPAVVLSIDAIQEFKEQTATYSAQYGFSANQVNISSKSGTNDLHGSLFWFDRNNFFDAQNYFYIPGAPQPILRQNQFGYVAGGPVIIPKVYNGRNKTFWLANYEGWRITQGLTTYQNVPDPTELTGNFSAFAGQKPCVSGAPVLNCLPVDPTTGNPFPGNQIPSSRFARIPRLMLAQGYIPAPNCNPLCNKYNHTETPTLPTTTNQQTYRIDQDLGKYGKIFGRGTLTNYNATNQGTPSVVVGTTTFTEDATNWEVNHTINFGPHVVNNFLFGHLNATANQGGYPMPVSQVPQLGLTGVFTQLSAAKRTPPGISFGNDLGENIAGYGGAGNSYTASNQPMWDFNDTVTWIVGNHTLSIGAEYRQWVFNRDLASNPLGNYSFHDYFSGNQVADFLLGYYANAATFQPSGLSAPTGNPRQFNFHYFAPYVQDDWKTTPNLTLNVGLRWDYRPFPYETNNHMGWLDTTNPNGGLCIADPTLVTKGVTAPAPGFQQFYRYCGKNTPKSAEKYDFGPRIGFAYRPFNNEKTVVRGGYGMYWDSVEGREIDGSADIYPYVVRTSLNQTPGVLLPGLNTTDQLFVNYSNTVGPVVPGQVGQDTFLAVNISENPKNPYVQQWSLSVQRELARNTTLEVNYIGNKGTHLLARQNINQSYTPNATCIAAAVANQQNGTKIPFNCTPIGRYPYPYFSTFINSLWGAYSNYNSANIKVERRTTSMALTAVYTWAKSMDDKSAAAGIGAEGGGYQGFTNNHDPNFDYGPSDFNVDHRFVSSMVYDLPVGRGKHFLSTANSAVNAVAGGWELTGIYTAQTGFPFSVTATDTSGFIGTTSPRAQVIGNPKAPFHKGLNQWFNTAAFGQPSIGVYGNSSRNYLRQPGINDFDIGPFQEHRAGRKSKPPVAP